MYSSLVQLLTFILIVFLGAVLYIRNKELRKLTNGKGKNIFLTPRESIKYVSDNADLSHDEKEKLEILCDIAGNNRLHLGFDDESIAQNWLTKVQRALFHNKSLEQDTLHELEFAAYEIFRKITVSRLSQTSAIKSIKDVPLFQNFIIEIPNAEEHQTVTCTLQKTDFTGFHLLVPNKDLFNKLSAFPKALLAFSFWNKMDSGYEFSARIIKFTTKDSECQIYVEYPKSIKRSVMRRYPRRNCEIPVYFNINHFESDFDSGGMVEKRGPANLGLISNIGGNGCSVISHIGFALGTSISLSCALFNHTISLKGTVRNISKNNDMYMLFIQFDDNISRESLLYIYRFLFAVISEIQY